MAVRGDQLDESDETLTLTLSNASPDYTEIGTIVDDDSRGLVFTPDAITVTEAAGPGHAADYTVALTSKPTAAVSVQVASIDDGVATVTPNGLDFTTSNWSDGQTITVTGVDDQVDNILDKTTINHTASGGDYASVTGSVALTITDDDDAPTGAITLALSPTKAGEATTVTVTATLPGSTTLGTDTDITVKIGDTGDTATEGTDYATVNDVTLTISAGSKTGAQTFSINPTQDTIDEGSGETVSVSGTTTTTELTVTGANFTIEDDDDAPPAAPTSLTATKDGRLAIDLAWTAPATANTRAAVTGYQLEWSANGTDGWTGLATITNAATRTHENSGLAPATTRHYRVRATSSEGTSAWSNVAQATTDANTAPVFNPATAARSVNENASVGDNVGAVLPATDSDSDALTYTMSGTDAASFDFNATTRQITVKTGAVPNYEAKASYQVTVNAADPYSGSASLTVNIAVNNLDEPGTVSLDGANPAVGSQLTASLSDPDGSVSATTWQWARSDTKNGSYANIPAATNAAYTPVAGDNGKWLRATASYTDGQGSGKSAQAIADNAVIRLTAPAVSLVLTPSWISENGGSTTVTATLSTASSEEVTLTVSAKEVSPATSSDFALSNNKQLTVAAGATTSTGTVTITAENNNVDAPNKTVTVSATVSGGNGISAPANQTRTITDDDDAPSGAITLALSPHQGQRGRQCHHRHRHTARIHHAQHKHRYHRPDRRHWRPSHRGYRLYQCRRHHAHHCRWCADALLVRSSLESSRGLMAASSIVHRLRLALKSSYILRMNNRASIAPKVQLGVRQDGGDAEQGIGVNVSGGLGFMHSGWGLRTQVDVHGLVVHEDSNFEEWGVSGMVLFDRSPSSDLGMSWRLISSWGPASSSTGGMRAILSRETISGPGRADLVENRSLRLKSRFDYGFVVFGEHGVASPYASISVSGGETASPLTNAGVEIGGGLGYSNRSLGLRMRAGMHGLMSERETGFEEWGVSGLIFFDPDPTSPLGASFNVLQSWGITMQSGFGGSQTMGMPRLLTGTSRSNPYGQPMRVEGEMGYGFSASDGEGVAIPYAGIAFSDQNRNSLLLGLNLQTGSRFLLNLEGSTPENKAISLNSIPEFRARVLLRW